MEAVAEALKLIQDTAQQAVEARVIAQHDVRKLVISMKGEIFEREIPPAVRDHHVRSLADLMNYVPSGECPKPVVFHQYEAVTLIVDDEDRRDKVTFPLHASKPFQALMELDLDKGKAALDQGAFIRLLRLTLGVPEEVILPFRSFNWQINESGMSQQDKKKESLGKSIEAVIHGVDDLPDGLLLSVPIYCDQGERDAYEIRCAVEYDIRNQKIYLCPLPGEMEAAVDNAQASIRRRLDAALEGVPVYYGQP